MPGLHAGAAGQCGLCRPVHRDRLPRTHLSGCYGAPRCRATQPRHPGRQLGCLCRLPLQRPDAERLFTHPPERNRLHRPGRPVVPPHHPTGRLRGRLVVSCCRLLASGRGCRSRILCRDAGRRENQGRTDRHHPYGRTPLHFPIGQRGPHHCGLDTPAGQ